ncbi:MAG: DegT/DnrJ/EryC1/StrS family aminotransferase [Firmicutes bacterium]|nr:DegT/DnrJ/EryC1/StrS family aminotransferase [Bacillota bacterium]
MEPFKNKVWLARPLMHGEELEYINVAFKENYITTAGTNISELEKAVAEKIGVKHVVGLSSGTAALHMAIKLAALKIYGTPKQGRGMLFGKKVFCSDVTFDATVNPVVYEDGEPVFIDSEYETWNMDPEALERAFEVYPDVKIIVVAHLYGFPAKIDEIKKIAEEHGAVIVEDAAESIIASYKGKMTGAWCADTGTGILSLNGNKLVTASSGGLLLTNDREAYEKVKKWSTQARESAPWYEHEELGYNYRMSNIIAGIGRGQMLHAEEHVMMKKAIYDRYKDGFKDLPVSMNSYDPVDSKPNFWLSCMIIDKEAMGEHVRSNRIALYRHVKGKTTPTEVLETLAHYNAEGRPIWKPMHMQPYYINNPFITKDGNGRARTNAYIEGCANDVGGDIFDRGLCLPSDINMTEEEQARVIEIVRSCFE